ncbi:hypothetical protein I350_08176 [Cryptococcus amylolentus CBS 6273]|uniref:BAG domain-containing protein n=1 Tax=Cryptococcus amylolentus CBS 6273 TaxID=1296118 RepID=A0A1E3JAQ0_9TREE|nr:hypothetical protein I350_08176 [Cryptococcus amylolentus CBS 6273]
MAYYYPAPYYYGYPAPSPVTIHTAPSPPPFFAPPTAPPHHAAHQQAFPPHHYQPSFVAPPSGHHPATAGPSLDEEEAAALTHLQAIKRRRQELEASRAHEAASAARAQAQKEAEVQALISKELAKQQALRARYEEEELRKRQYREAIQRQRQELKAARAAERQKAAQYQTRSRDLAPNSAFGHDDVSNVLGSLFGIKPAQEPQYDNCFAPRSSANSLEARSSSAARACASAGQGREQKSQQPKSEHDVFSLTDLLRSIGLIEDDVSGPTCSEQCTNSQAPTASSTPSATTSSAQRPSQSGLPAEVNDILHRYLGLHIDPVASQDSAPSVKDAKGNGVPAGLNELLSQFGLVFEPETETETKPGPSHSAQPDNAAHPSAVDSATQSKPTAPQTAPSPQPPKPATPFTSLLGEFTNVHPAVADILRNVEVAVTEEVKQRTRAGKAGCTGPCDQQCASGCQKASGQAKGKGVAEGEKNPVLREAEPEPAVNPTTSLSTLDDIQHQFESLRANFTFPEYLSFARDSRGSHSPPLLFNRINSAYHAQVNALLQLLLQTDSINSGGEKAVRQKRKEVVKKVEDEIERLEQLRDDLWEDVKERRERGEESEPDADQERSWSDTDSVKNEVTVGEGETIVEPEQTEASGETEGYEVVDNQAQDATPAEATVPTDAPAPAEDSTPAEDSVPTETPIPASASAPTEDLEQPQSPSYADAAKHALEQSQEPSAQTPIPESAPESSAIEPQAEAVPAEQDAASAPQQVDASPLPSASHHPVTVEDAEDENEDRKQKRDRKIKRQARRAGSDAEDYEIL